MTPRAIASIHADAIPDPRLVEIDAETLECWLMDGAAVMVDVREAGEFSTPYSTLPPPKKLVKIGPCPQFFQLIGDRDQFSPASKGDLRIAASIGGPSAVPTRQWLGPSQAATHYACGSAKLRIAAALPAP